VVYKKISLAIRQDHHWIGLDRVRPDLGNGESDHFGNGIVGNSYQQNREKNKKKIVNN